MSVQARPDQINLPGSKELLVNMLGGSSQPAQSHKPHGTCPSSPGTIFRVVLILIKGPHQQGFSWLQEHDACSSNKTSTHCVED
jgi:hypothetical protein